MSGRRCAGAAALLLFVAAVAAANYVTGRYGLVPAGFGRVTAGTYAAGLVFVLRDAVQELLGRGWALAAIALGAVLSVWLADGRLALASGLAFAVSELADLAVWQRLRRRGWRRAMFGSNVVGAAIDTIVFLPVAGYAVTWATFGGQLVVKGVYVTLAVLLAGELVGRMRAGVVSRERVNGAGAGRRPGRRDRDDLHAS